MKKSIPELLQFVAHALGDNFGDHGAVALIPQGPESPVIDGPVTISWLLLPGDEDGTSAAYSVIIFNGFHPTPPAREPDCYGECPKSLIKRRGIALSVDIASLN